MPIARVNGKDINYAGAGDTIFFMHGLTGSHADWKAQIDAGGGIPEHGHYRG